MLDETLRTLRAALALALTALALGGCEAPAADACESITDCFGGEACEEGRCVPDEGPGGDAGVDAGGGAAEGCGHGLTSCSGMCVDLQRDPIRCGSCGNPCASTEACEAGECVDQVEDCRADGADCRGFTYCDESSGACEEGCASDDQCGLNHSCDPSTHACVLAPAPIRVAASLMNSCVLTDAGEASCWGQSDDGMTTPPPERFTQISAGDDHACGITIAGEVRCWGDNAEGESAEVAGSFIWVSAGGSFSCGVRSSGKITCWGGGPYSMSVLEEPAGENFVQVSAGGFHACGLTSTGAVRCWGDNDTGQTVEQTGDFAQVSAGGFHSCGLTSAGAIRCWGDDGSGPSTAIEGSFVQVSAGEHHTCGITTAGKAQCWGLNEQGQAEEQEGNFVQISAGEEHTCGLLSGGRVKCWGSDMWGQLEP